MKKDRLALEDLLDYIEHRAAVQGLSIEELFKKAGVNETFFYQMKRGGQWTNSVRNLIAIFQEAGGKFMHGGDDGECVDYDTLERGNVMLRLVDKAKR